MKEMTRHVISLFVAVLIFCLGSMAYAETSLFSSWEEAQLYREVNDGHYIKTRQEVEKILSASPESLGANYLMGQIFWNGEGNLHRALQYYKKTIRLFEAKYCDASTGIPTDGSLVSWHQRLYKELSDIYAELDLRELELEVHEKLAQLYHAQLGEDAVWAMIKLGKYEEARAIALHSIQGQDKFWADAAYNDLVAIEDARHRYMASYEMSVKSVEFHAGKSCVVLMNHGRALATLLRMNESNQYYLKAATVKNVDCMSHPLGALALNYLADGRWQKSISSETRLSKRKVDKRTAIQTEMNERSTLAQILYTMGFSERAHELMTTVIKAPSRLGYDSLLKAQMDMANETLYYAILKDSLARTEEILSAYGALGASFFERDAQVRERRIELARTKLETERQLWSSHQKLFKSALHAENLNSLIVPFYVLSVPNLTPSLVDALGRRTGDLLLDYQKGLLEADEYEAMEPVFHYLSAYIAWRDGDDARLTQEIEAYRRSRVEGVRLIDWEIDLMEAQMWAKQGRIGEADVQLSHVYRDYPSIFRTREVRLPVRFDDAMGKGEVWTRMREALERSERFEMRENAPFVIAGVEGEIPMLCLLSATGQRYACSSVQKKDYAYLIDEKPHEAEIVGHFLHAVFVPRVDLSQSDIHSLDGSTSVVTADEALSGLLKATSAIRDENKIDVSDLQEMP